MHPRDFNRSLLGSVGAAMRPTPLLDAAAPPLVRRGHGHAIVSDDRAPRRSSPRQGQAFAGTARLLGSSI